MANAKVCDQCGSFIFLQRSEEEDARVPWAGGFPEENPKVGEEPEVSAEVIEHPLGPMLGIKITQNTEPFNLTTREFCSALCMMMFTHQWALRRGESIETDFNVLLEKMFPGQKEGGN